MREFICRLRSDKTFAICVLGLVLTVTGLFVFHTYASLTPEEQAKRRYDQLMAEEVASVL